MMGVSPLVSLANGFLLNIRLFAITLVLALPLGLLFTLLSTSRFKPVRAVMKVFIWVIRGTPLMLLLFIVLYAPGLLFGIPVSTRFTAAIIAFVINYAAYFSEIFRGGIESISVGQYEAGEVLGMKRSQIFLRVVLLQVIKRIVPPMSNEIITLIKDTALARVIGIGEIIMSAERFTKMGIIWPLFSTALFFLVFVGVLTLVFNWLERKLDYFKV